MSFDRAIGFARDLIRIPSLPGQEGELAARVLAEYEALGFDEVWTDAVGNCLARVRGTGGAPAVMLSSHLHAPRRWPRSLDPRLALPDPIEELLVQLVARRPADRPRTAYELRARLLELEPLAPEEPFAVPPPSGGPPWDPPAA